MQVIILGSGSPLVVPDRAGPATLVRIGKMDLLFDCGRAVLMRGAAVGNAVTLAGPVPCASALLPAPSSVNASKKPPVTFKNSRRSSVLALEMMKSFMGIPLV